MFRFKKAGSFLSIVAMFSVVAGSFPIQTFAELYTGELRLPNTNVVSDYGQVAGGRQVTMSTFNNGYFPSEPTFSARESNNFITSLPQKVFSASIRDGVLNCGSNDINLNPANNSIVLTGTAYANDENNSSYSIFCQPNVWPTTQNTVLTNGGLGVTQTHDALPAFTIGESVQNTVVESIPNDPNNVRVTVSENVIQESYGLHFERRGDVWSVYSGRDMTRWYEDTGLYKDGSTYIINWLSNWVGQMPISLGDEYGTVLWGDPSTANYDGDSGRTTYDALYVNTGYPTPQITQLASIAPALVSSSVVRPRNGDILSETDASRNCTRWTDGGMFRTVQHIYCIKYAITADGRTGRAIIYDSASSSGWVRDLLGAGLMLAGIVSGAEFVTAFLEASSWSSAFVLDQLVPNIVGGAINDQIMSSLGAFTTGAVAAVAGRTVYGTAEQAIASSGVEGQERVWIWTWSPTPGFQPTTDRGDNDLCLNIEGIQTAVPAGYTRDATNETCIRGVCPNGASNYPICTIILNRCSDGSVRPASGICPETDLCLNIAGIQSTVPAGYTRNASGNCTRGGDTDLCLNIAGIQSTVPSGYTRNASGNCVRSGEPIDLCSNLAGIQSTVPAGYTRDASGVCTSILPNITSWQVVPTLVRSGEPTFVSWNATDVSDCTVSGKSNKSWNGKTGTSEQSDPIFGQTVFSISCAALAGASPATVSTSSKTVNIIPTFQEQ